MGNVRYISCPELRIQTMVGKGVLFTGQDNKGFDRIWMLGLFLEACIGKELIYHREDDEHDERLDVRWHSFDHNRDYEANPLTEADDKADDEQEAAWAKPSRSDGTPLKGQLGTLSGTTVVTEGWANATPDVISRLTKAVVTGGLVHIHGSNIITDSFKDKP